MCWWDMLEKGLLADGCDFLGKQRKNRAKTVRGVAKGKAATKDKKK